MHIGLLVLQLEDKSSPVTNPLAENANVGDSKNTAAKIMRIFFTAKPPMPQSYSQSLLFPKDAWWRQRPLRASPWAFDGADEIVIEETHRIGSSEYFARG
jgi:hypothetical protein